jgi:hypothetical protein
MALLKRIGCRADVGGVEGSTDTTAHRQAKRIARLARLFAFVVPLILASLLLGIRSAQAAVPALGPVPLAFEEEFGFEEEDEDEFAEEECEIAEEELKEGELSAADANAICKEAEGEGETAGPSSAATAECPIHSATAHAATLHDNRLKLTLGYTTNTPVNATIQLRKGSTKIGSFKRHLAKSGVLRFTDQMGKEHGRLAVRIKLPPGSAGCPSRRLVLFPR